MTRHIRNAAGNFAAIYDQDLVDAFEAEEAGMPMPAGATDPLDYLGSITPLRLTEDDKGKLGKQVGIWVGEKGPGWVWSNRTRLKLELAAFWH
jgi:hypothetical protein